MAGGNAFKRSSDWFSDVLKILSYKVLNRICLEIYKVSIKKIKFLFLG